VQPPEGCSNEQEFGSKSTFGRFLTEMKRAQIILASNSPRRRQLLALTNLEFRVVSVPVDETPHAHESPRKYVIRMAASKAQAVQASLNGDGLVIASDTTVVDGGQILGKPVDAANAVQMLTQLRGRTHQVYTSIAVLRLLDGFLRTDICDTAVPMRNYSDEEIQVYIASGDPLDKAGAYAIQHVGFHPAENMQGCFANVMGLPLCHLRRLLGEFEVELGTNVPQACQDSLRYPCPIFGMIISQDYGS